MGVLQVLQWNCRGILGKIDFLLPTLFSNTDIIVLQETFLKSSSSLVIPGKVIFRLDREARPGGGLLIAVNSSLPSSRLVLSCEIPNVEILGVSVGLASFSIQIINVYSPSGDVASALSSSLQHVTGPTLLLGDFNLHHPLWGSSSSSRFSEQFVSWICAENVCLLNSSMPTHIAPSGTLSLLDLSLCSSDLLDRVSLQVNEDAFDSDHFPVHLSLATSFVSPSPRLFYRWPAICREVNSALSSISSICYDDLLGIIQRAMSNHSFMRRPSPAGFPAWWSAKCFNFYYQKKFLFKLATRRVSSAAWDKYRRFAAKLRRAIKEAKRKFWDTTCRDASNPYFLFKILNVLKKRSQPSLDAHLCLQRDGESVFQADRQAELFATVYSNAAGHEPLPLTYGPPQENGLNLPFTLLELQTAIQRMRVSSPGADNISAKLFKGFSEHSCEVLLGVFNDIWSSGEIPEDWATAILVPILKPGKSPRDGSSYRPIALTSVVCKLCEKMIACRLSTHLTRNKLLNPRHFGFLQFRDSQSALALLYHDLMRAKKDKKFILGISLDIKAAYDSVYIDGLIYKCAQLGITGPILRWIHRFLNNRRFRVRWRSIFSQYRRTTRGVPQGSVLSPILFMIFLADFFEMLGIRVKCIVYADDIFLYCINDSLEACRLDLQDALRQIYRWCQYWKLEISPSKSYAINLSRRKGACEFQFWFNGAPIPWTSSIKFLGFYFANRGGLRPQVEYLRSKAFQKINILKALSTSRYGARSNHLLQIAKASILSLANYGAAILCTASDSLLSKLEVIHSSSLRIALGLPRWTPNLVLRKHANSPPLNLRLQDLSFRFWLKHLSLGPWSPMAELFSTFRGHRSLASWNPLSIIPRSFDVLGWHSDHLLSYSYPQLPISEGLVFLLSGLPFQNSSRNDRMISAYFLEFIYSLDDHYDLIGTDASKSACLTAIAGCSQSGSFGYRTPHVNSIFTAEALAIGTAVDELTSARPFILFSDSLSVLTALQSASVKSPTVILWLLAKLGSALNYSSRIILCWVPGHSGIPLNERADQLAGRVGQHDVLLDWVSSEDIAKAHTRQMTRSFALSFSASRYSSLLGEIPSVRETLDWVTSRREDVLISRSLCKMHITPDILYRFNLATSNLCTKCGTVDSLEHILLVCAKYAQHRATHFGNLVSSLYYCSFVDFLQQVYSSADFRGKFLRFIKSIDRF